MAGGVFGVYGHRDRLSVARMAKPHPSRRRCSAILLGYFPDTHWRSAGHLGGIILGINHPGGALQRVGGCRARVHPRGAINRQRHWLELNRLRRQCWRPHRSECVASSELERRTHRLFAVPSRGGVVCQLFGMVLAAAALRRRTHFGFFIHDPTLWHRLWGNVFARTRHRPHPRRHRLGNLRHLRGKLWQEALSLAGG